MKGMAQDGESTTADEMESGNSSALSKEESYDTSPSPDHSADVSMSHTAATIDSRSQNETLPRPSAFAKRRNSEHEESNSQQGDETKSTPQHHGVEANTYQRDMDFEVALLTQRNRRVLLSRLQEVAPRGRLSLVRFDCLRRRSIAFVVLIASNLSFPVPCRLICAGGGWESRRRIC